MRPQMHFLILSAQYAMIAIAASGAATDLAAGLRRKLLQFVVALPKASGAGWHPAPGVPYGTLVHYPSVLLGGAQCAGMA